MFSFQGTLQCIKTTFEKLDFKFLKTVLGGDEESPVFASQIPSAQRPNTSYSVPVSQHSLIKQSHGLFFLTVRAFRSSTPKVSRLILLRVMLISEVLIGGDEESRTPDPLLARQVLSQLSYTPILNYVVTQQ